MYGTIIGTIDVAQVALYAFWLFFAGLIWYLQRENMREGYPLVNEDGSPAPNQGVFPLPSPKTFKLPHGGGEVTVPGPETEREVNLKRTAVWNGAPFEPAGDPLADGVGPAAWAERADKPDLTLEGKIKIRPLRNLGEWHLAVPKNDPRGLPVYGGDGKKAGTVHDLWIDQSEQLIRYIEVDLTSPGRRLLPMTLARLTKKGVHVHSLYADQFAGVPKVAGRDKITLLEEDKISAYWCGGKLYADSARLETQI
jgi:photosynthetic reaction center H subunit